MHEDDKVTGKGIVESSMPIEKKEAKQPVKKEKKKWEETSEEEEDRTR